MRFRFVGDHSDLHCGCTAVANVIRRFLTAAGSIVSDSDDYDALVVNGEGSMHHGSITFHRKMSAIKDAQKAGKRTYLINSVWHLNPLNYDAALLRLDDLVVRGNASLRDLASRHCMGARRMLDFSYFEPIDENAPFTDLGGAIATTDIYAPSFGFVWLSATPESARWVKLSLRNMRHMSWPSLLRRLRPGKLLSVGRHHAMYAAQLSATPEAAEWVKVDMRRVSWSSLIKTLRTASLLIAGRHHGMYAACRARVPFVPFAGNSHKFEDLLDSAPTAIPICRSVKEISPLIEWAKKNAEAYQRLFDWMESEPSWNGIAGECRAPKRIAAGAAAFNGMSKH